MILDILSLYPLIFSQVQPKSPKRFTALRANVDVSIMKTSVRQDTKFPLFSIIIPETPESEKKRHCTTRPFSEDPFSPVSRSPRSRGLVCKAKLLSRRSLQLQNKTSPKPGDTLESENTIGCFGSLKRLGYGSEMQQTSKRSRSREFEKSFEQDSSSDRDYFCKFHQNIHEAADLKDVKSKGFSKNIEKKSDKILSEKNSSISTLSSNILRNINSEKSDGANGSIIKLPRINYKISSSEDEKENIDLSTEPSTDLTEISSDNQSDLVVSYSSWLCNSDAGEKKENVLSCEIEKKSKQVNNLGDEEKAITAAEENVTILDDSWFNDQMEQSFEEPEHEKSELEYVCLIFCIYKVE